MRSNILKLATQLVPMAGGLAFLGVSLSRSQAPSKQQDQSYSVDMLLTHGNATEFVEGHSLFKTKLGSSLLAKKIHPRNGYD